MRANPNNTIWLTGDINFPNIDWASSSIISSSSIPMKPYIKGQYWMITTIPLDDNYQPGSYHPVG